MIRRQMQARALQNKTAIAGIGCTDFSRDSGRSEYQLALEAAVAACKDAGISPHEIDCITLSSYQSETVDEAELINGLGIAEPLLPRPGRARRRSRLRRRRPCRTRGGYRDG